MAVHEASTSPSHSLKPPIHPFIHFTNSWSVLFTFFAGQSLRHQSLQIIEPLPNQYPRHIMRFSAATFVFGLVALTAAAPTPTLMAKRALTSQSYAQFQVSDGTAGNALSKVQANFPVRATSCLLYLPLIQLDRRI